MRASLLATLCIALCGGLVWWASATHRHPQPHSKRRDRKVAWGARSPSEVRKQGNQLKGEPSLYLRQHAHNPLDWYPWSEEALQRATTENKPIFLSIGYASCHWCHVMEKEVFEDDEVAAFMNRHFINIKVDREERPDLDAVYMEALQAISGRGGWPMSLFLTPELKPFFGRTYLPRERFLALARRLHRIFRGDRGQVDSQAQRLYAAVTRQTPIPHTTAGGPKLRKIAGRAVERLLRATDHQWGGLAGDMKFPSAPIWQFALRRYRRTGNRELSTALRKTLDGMATGGIHDQIGGGFHRYAVEPTWVVPHFEKMLYDNALLARLYAESAAVFSVDDYRQTARQTLDFMVDAMSDDLAKTGFYSSYDADSDGGEGSYYLWTPAQLNRLAGPIDGRLLAKLLSVTVGGNFKGRSIPLRRTDLAAVAREHQRSPEQVSELLQDWRQRLQRERNKRRAPTLDKKVVTAWNGLAIAALAIGARLLGERRYAIAAANAAEWLWRYHRRADGTLIRASNASIPGANAVLDDYAFLADGLLELFFVTQNPKFLRRSLALLALVENKFSDPELGYYFTPRSTTAPLGRRVRVADGVRPAGLSVLLRTMLRISTLRSDSSLRQRVRSLVNRHREQLAAYPLHRGTWLETAELLAGPAYEVVIAGKQGRPETEALLRPLHRNLPAHVALIRVPAEGASPATLALLPAARGKRALGGRPTAFVCQLGSCKQPVYTPNALQSQLLGGWKH